MDRICAGARRPETWFAAMLLAAAIAQHLLSERWMLAVNLSESLPGRVLLVRKGAKPCLGAVAVFRLAPGLASSLGHPEGVLWAKRVAGLPGDRVSVSEGGTVSVAGRPAGRAQPRSSSGRRLHPLADVQEVPEGFLFVSGEHEDSLDSRYREFGLVPAADVIGAAGATEEEGACLARIPAPPVQAP